MTATCAARWPRRLRNAIDYALGYGIKDCEWCGVRFSARDEWQDGQTVKAGPYTTRLAYCRDCAGKPQAALAEAWWSW